MLILVRPRLTKPSTATAGESGSKEPAEDPTRPASAGRPAYDEDRQYFEQKGDRRPTSLCFFHALRCSPTPPARPPPTPISAVPILLCSIAAGSSSEPEKQKSKDKPSGPGKSFGPLDGGVSGGQYGCAAAGQRLRGAFAVIKLGCGFADAEQERMIVDEDSPCALLTSRVWLSGGCEGTATSSTRRSSTSRTRIRSSWGEFSLSRSSVPSWRWVRRQA